VLLGNGNGTFQGQQTFGTGAGTSPASVTLGDVNGDGRLDIITANYGSDNASVLLNSLAFTGQTANVVADTLVISGPINITSDTDTGEDDNITSVGLPVVTFNGESNLVLRLIGADGSTPLSQGTQYAVSSANGTYTVSFLDAAPQTTGLQPFGTYSNNTPTGNGTNISDGTYTIDATDAAGNLIGETDP